MSKEAGKGDKPRKYSKNTYDKNYDSINWLRKKNSKLYDLFINKILKKQK